MVSRNLRDETFNPDPTQVPIEEPQQETDQIPSFQLQLEEETEKTLIQIVLDDFQTAKKDRNQQDFGLASKGGSLTFESWMEKLKRVYSGKRDAKTIPWQYSSNRSLRIGTAILEMLHARLVPAIWNEDLARWRPGETTDTPKVDRISKFMDWWIRVWAPMGNFFDGWTKYTLGFGDSLAEGSWEVEEEESRESNPVPVVDESGQPMLDEAGAPISTPEQAPPKRLERTKFRLIEKEKFYLLKGARDIQKDMVIIEEEILC